MHTPIEPYGEEGVVGQEGSWAPPLRQILISALQKELPTQGPLHSPAVFLSIWTLVKLLSRPHSHPQNTHIQLALTGVQVCPAHSSLAGSKIPDLKKQKISFLSTTQA